MQYCYIGRTKNLLTYGIISDTEIGRGRRGSYDFPNITDGSNPGWVDSTRTGISVPGEALEGASPRVFGCLVFCL